MAELNIKTGQQVRAELFERERVVNDYLAFGDPAQMETEPETQTFEGRMRFIRDAAAECFAPYAMAAWAELDHHEAEWGNAIKKVDDLPPPFDKRPDPVMLIENRASSGA